MNYFESMKDQNARKARMKDRLRKEGRWAEFCAYRESIKGGGLPSWLTGLCAFCDPKFAPADGSLPEFTPDYYHNRLARYQGKGSPANAAAAADGRPGALSQADLLLGGVKTIHKNRVNAVEELKWSQLRRRVASAKRRGRSRAGDDEASTVRWLYNHVDCRVDDIDPLDVPSVGAIRHLRRLKESDAAYDSLVNGLWAKLLAKNLESGEVSGPGDDGRKQLRALDKLGEITADMDDAEVAKVLRGDARPEAFAEEDDEEDDYAAELAELEGQYADSQKTVPQLGEGAEGSQQEHRVPSPTLEGGAGI